MIFGLGETAGTIFWTVSLLGVILYSTAVFLLQTVGDKFPWDPSYQSLGDCMYMLLRIVTLDGWSEIINDMYIAKDMDGPSLFDSYDRLRIPRVLA